MHTYTELEAARVCSQHMHLLVLAYAPACARICTCFAQGEAVREPARARPVPPPRLLRESSLRRRAGTPLSLLALLALLGQLVRARYGDAQALNAVYSLYSLY